MAGSEMQIVGIEKDDLANLLPWPTPDANKYTRGKTTIIGGCAKYPGAACLAALAAEHMGAGYVYVACSREALPIIHSQALSVVAEGWEGFDVENSSLANIKEGHPQACLIGSGMDGQLGVESRLFFQLMYHCDCPLVVDGGAISYLATVEGMNAVRARRDRSDVVLTPHLGEAKRLALAAGIDVPEPCVNSGEDEAVDQAFGRYAFELSEAYCATVMLKGTVTYIKPYGKDLVHKMSFGTAALAKAGTGDVLAGMTTSLLSQGASAESAAILAASLHGLAGQLAASKLTDICVCAEDVICNLPETILSILC